MGGENGFIMKLKRNRLKNVIWTIYKILEHSGKRNAIWASSGPFLWFCKILGHSGHLGRSGRPALITLLLLTLLHSISFIFELMLLFANIFSYKKNCSNRKFEACIKSSTYFDFWKLFRWRFLVQKNGNMSLLIWICKYVYVWNMKTIVRNMLKVNNKDIRMMCLTLFWCLYC